MKRTSILLIILTLVAFAATAQQMQLPRVSQKATVGQTIGFTDVTITYSRPGVKSRAIWGALVPYDQVWRTGANEATQIKFSGDVMINGQKLAAGSYSLHTIPSKDEWTIIFNKVADQWGSYSYDEKQDALRIKVKPEQAPFTEWLQFSFPVATPSSATAELRWESLRVPFTIDADTATQAMKNARAAVENMNNWRTPYNAANYAYDANAGNKDEATKWIERSIALNENFWNLRLKANMLARDGDVKAAIPLAEKAVQLGKEKKEEASEIEKTEKTLTEWKAKK